MTKRKHIMMRLGKAEILIRGPERSVGIRLSGKIDSPNL